MTYKPLTASELVKAEDMQRTLAVLTSVTEMVLQNSSLIDLFATSCQISGVEFDCKVDCGKSYREHVYAMLHNSYIKASANVINMKNEIQSARDMMN